jgi:hypothetical protein
MLGAMSVRRRSQRVILVLIGTAALPACTPGLLNAACMSY